MFILYVIIALIRLSGYNEISSTSVSSLMNVACKSYEIFISFSNSL